jgi:hypothetical protein
LTRIKTSERNTCGAVRPRRPLRGLLQAAHQIAPHLLDHLMLAVKKIGYRLQQRLQAHALPHQFDIRKADLPRRRSRATAQLFLCFAAPARARFNALTQRGPACTSRS